MAFTQKLFSSYHNYPDGNTRVGELNRIWYDSNTNTLRIQLDATPGGTIISGGGGLVLQALSVSTVAASSGGTLTYSNGTFTYAPADLSSLASTTYVNNQIDAVKDRIVSPNDQHSAIIANNGTTTFGGDVVPGATTYTLGTAALPWKDLYVSKGSIIIADNDPTVDGVSIRNTNKYIVIDQGGLKVTADDETHEVFQLDNTGKLILKSEQPALTTTAALDLIGNLLGTTLPTNNLGVMLHATGTQDQPSRIYLDGIGTQGSGQSAYAAFIGRYARGTVESPLPAEAGDILARFGGNAHSATLGLNTISNVRVDMVATEQQTDAGRGSRMEFWTTPIGSIIPQRSVHIDSQGIDLSEATDINAGVTFKNGSLLKYWPSQTGNTGKILRTDGTDFFWDSETVPTGIVLFKGDWSAANPPGGGTPTISDATGELGWQWIVSAAGTQDLGSGNITFAVGDLVIHNGTRYIKIEATTPQVQADWTVTNTSLPAYIKHKPTLATVATSGSYDDLGNKPYIPAAQVNADWNATTGLAQILNKPSIPTQYTDTLARAAITLTSNTPSGTTSTLNYVDGVFTFTSAAALVSGTTIKTVNSNSLLGSGNVTVGTVTSVSGTGTVSGLTLSGTVSVSGSLTLGGTLSGITNSNLSGTAGITNANLANSTISGVSLGNNLYNLTAGTGITFSSGTTYNGSAAITINNSITQYTDALARDAHSAGTGISYNSSTGVISSTITQYTDALARSAISVSGSLSYNSSTGVVSYTTPTYTVTTASASGGGALSLTGTTFTFTPASIPSYGVGTNQLVYELNASLSLTSAKNTLVSMFGLTSGVALQSNTRYQYEIVFTLSSNKAGAISYALALSGGAVVAQHNFQWMANKTATIDGYSAGIAMASFNATGAAITTAKDIAAFDNFTHVVIYGNIDVTTAGNVNFMLSQDQTTPITWTMLAGAYVKLLPIGAIGANTVAGTWS